VEAGFLKGEEDKEGKKGKEIFCCCEVSGPESGCTALHSQGCGGNGEGQEGWGGFDEVLLLWRVQERKGELPAAENRRSQPGWGARLGELGRKDALPGMLQPLQEKGNVGGVSEAAAAAAEAAARSRL